MSAKTGILPFYYTDLCTSDISEALLSVTEGRNFTQETNVFKLEKKDRGMRNMNFLFASLVALCRCLAESTVQ